MTQPAFTSQWARDILRGETNPYRFEEFCVELYTQVDGIHYVRTTRNYDQGRDGRATRIGDPSAVIIATTTVNVFDKAEADANKLSKHPPIPSTIRFCATEQLTERALDEVKAIIREQCPTVRNIRADAGAQLPELAIQYPSIFEKHYSSALSTIREALATPDGTSERIQLTGLRIALTTQLFDDVRGIRDDLQRNLVLTVLADGRPRTLEQLTTEMSEALSLSQPIRAEYLHEPVSRLVAANLITGGSGAYLISMSGLQELGKRTDAGAAMLAEGEKLFRQLLLTLSGQELTDEQFNVVWHSVQNVIAAVFLRNGIYLTDAVGSMARGDTIASDHPDFHSAIQELGDTVAALGLWGQNSKTVGLAVADAFHERTSDAFRWLAQVCSIYVTLCSLGLDPQAQKQIAARLRQIDLLLDTDIVLSLLSVAEPNHSAVEGALKGWISFGGNVYVTSAVLEEAAYHAWISNVDYEDTWRQLGKLSDAEAMELIDNVFVRAFRQEAQGKYHPAAWEQYIGYFRGSSKFDFAKIELILREMKMFRLADDEKNQDFAEMAGRMVLRKVGPAARGYVSQEQRDKCRRDGRLIAVLRQHREKRARMGGSAMIVSSASALRKVVCEFREQLGGQEALVPVGVVAYFLSHLPGANLNMKVLTELLFDVGHRPKLEPIVRVALRAVHASGQYSVPFSTRPRLGVALTQQIAKTAREYGKPYHVVESAFVHGKEEQEKDRATILADALDSVAISRAEAEMEKRVRRKSGY